MKADIRISDDVRAEDPPPVWLDIARRQSGRFWAHVDKQANGCWLWRAGKDKDGYGKFAISGPRRSGRQQQKHFRAHRLSYELTHGPIAADVMLLHSCDTPACLNPEHLRPGTQLQNRTDCKDRGRAARGDRHGSHTRPDRVARGERHGSAGLVAQDVAEIRRLAATGLKPTPIARTLNRSVNAIKGVLYGKTWQHAGTNVATVMVVVDRPGAK